jgi:hypothetical protein
MDDVLPLQVFPLFPDVAGLIAISLIEMIASFILQ